MPTVCPARSDSVCGTGAPSLSLKAMSPTYVPTMCAFSALSVKMSTLVGPVELGTGILGVTGAPGSSVQSPGKLSRLTEGRQTPVVQRSTSEHWLPSSHSVLSFLLASTQPLAESHVLV